MRQASPVKTYTDDEQRRIYKFRGVGGYELFISGFGKERSEGVFADIRDEFGGSIETGNFRVERDSKSSKSISVTGLFKSIQPKKRSSAPVVGDYSSAGAGLR